MDLLQQFFVVLAIVSSENVVDLQVVVFHLLVV